jgi:Uma2 family endonuclease
MQHHVAIPSARDEAVTSNPRNAASTYDHRVTLHGVTWEQYEALLAIRGDGAGVRMAYLEGELELMSPSRSHESIKKFLARLLEAYAEEKGLELNGFGSMTLRNRPKERGVEPDECYELGGPKESPDIAIEVVWTSGGLDKLEIYKALGVREVWIWRDGHIEVHALRSEQYEPVARSEILPELDLVRLAELADTASQTQAVREFRRGLREK